MTENKSSIRNLLKNLIVNSNVSQSSKNFNINEIRRFLIESRIEGIFLELSRSNFNWEEKDRSILKEIEESSFKRFIKTSENLRYLREAIKEFDKMGIQFLILKGGYLTTNIYEKISNRPINDIDIFIRESENNSAIQALENIGLKPRDEVYTSNLHIRPMENFNKSVRFDIHNKLFINELDTDNYFKNKVEISIFEEKIYIPEGEIFFLNLIEHGTSRGNFDVGIQYLFDVYYFLKKINLDSYKLQTLAKRYNLIKELEISDALMKCYFDKSILQETNISKEIINASENIIFGPFIHNKTTNLLQNEMVVNELSSIKIINERHKNVFLNAFKVMLRYMSLITKYLPSIINLIFKKDYKEVLRAKIIINRYFHD